MNPWWRWLILLGAIFLGLFVLSTAFVAYRIVKRPELPNPVEESG